MALSLENLVAPAADPHFPQGGEHFRVSGGGLGIRPHLEGAFDAVGSGNLSQANQRTGGRRSATQ